MNAEVGVGHQQSAALVEPEAQRPATARRVQRLLWELSQVRSLSRQTHNAHIVTATLMSDMALEENRTCN